MGLFTKTKSFFGTIFVGKNKNGKEVVVEAPSTKSNRYFNERQNGTNSITGETLTDTQLAYRSGYNASQKDNAGIYKAKQKYKD